MSNFFTKIYTTQLTLKLYTLLLFTIMVCLTHRQSVLLKTTSYRQLITIVFMTKLTALDAGILSESFLFKKPSFLDQTLSYKAKHRKQNVIHLSSIN